MTIRKCVLLLFLVVSLEGYNRKWVSVFQKISNDPELSQYAALVQENQKSRLSLHAASVTVFAPTNKAFQSFGGNLHSRLSAYHIVKGAKTLMDLDGPLFPIAEEYPPVWVSKQNDDVYVNNAKVIRPLSNYQQRNHKDKYGQEQVLHVIDQLLDPVKYGDNAFNLLKSNSWNIPYSAEKFSAKILQYNAKKLFTSSRINTFLIPIDENNENLLKQVDLYAVKAHIIPDLYLFTRPALKHFPYETLANDGYINVVVSFIESDGRVYVRSKTILGDSNHPQLEVTSEIIKANIPVANGVVHFINRPLMVIERTLKKFPYLPIYDKVVADYYLNYSADLATSAGLYEQFKNERKTYTYFVPSDRAWKHTQKLYGLKNLDGLRKYAKEIIGRHIVESNKPFTMSRLERMNAAGKQISLPSQHGLLAMNVTRTRAGYFIVLNGKSVRVTRADYECSNGIVHVVDDVLLTPAELKQFGLINILPIILDVFVAFNKIVS